MLKGFHALVEGIFGDTFADLVLQVIQWGSFAGVVYLAFANLSLFGIALPSGVTAVESIAVMIPLIVVAGINTID